MGQQGRFKAPYPIPPPSPRYLYRITLLSLLHRLPPETATPIAPTFSSGYIRSLSNLACLRLFQQNSQIVYLNVIVLVGFKFSKLLMFMASAAVDWLALFDVQITTNRIT